MTKISVIIPVYNSEKYLHKCIDSVLAQTFDDFELLLINDGSTDGSGEICDEYAKKDKRIKVFHTSNFGVSSARNFGLQNSSGDYILFVDADDWIEDQYIEDFQNALINFDFDLIISGYQHDNPLLNKSIRKSIVNQKSIKEDGISKILTPLENGNFLSSVWGKLFKKKIIVENNVAFDRKISFGEDTLFTWSYLFHIKSISVINKTGYHYIQQSSSISLTYKMDTYENLMYINNLIFKAKKNVSAKFKLNTEDIQHNIEMEYLMMEIRAVLSMYNMGFERNRSFRVQKVKELSKNQNVKLMPNQTIYMKIIKLMLENKQNHLLDILLLLKHRLFN